MIFEYIFVLGGDIATWCQILGGNVTGEFTKGGNVNADSKNWEVIWRLMGENKKADYGRKYEYAPLKFALLYLRGALTRLSSMAKVETDWTKKANIVSGTFLARCSSEGWLQPIHSIRPLTETRPGISSKTKMQLWLEDNLALDICTFLDADIWKGLLGLN